MARKPPPAEAPQEGTRAIHSEDPVEIISGLDRRQAEALALEVRALARRYGLGPASVEIEIRGGGEEADPRH